MKYIITIIFSLVLAFPVYASEAGGTFSTGVSTGVPEVVLIEAPTASPAPNSYTSAKSITLTGGEGTQSIQYTTNSGTITCSSGTTYNTPIAVTTSTTIQAISCYSDGFASDAVNFAYIISSSGGGGGNSGGGGGGGTSYGGGITPAPNNADFNGDGKVDIIDLATLSTNWGSTTATHSTGDANGDGNVDITDLSILSTQWTG